MPFEGLKLVVLSDAMLADNRTYKRIWNEARLQKPEIGSDKDFADAMMIIHDAWDGGAQFSYPTGIGYEPPETHEILEGDLRRTICSFLQADDAEEKPRRRIRNRELLRLIDLFLQIRLASTGKAPT